MVFVELIKLNATEWLIAVEGGSLGVAVALGDCAKARPPAKARPTAATASVFNIWKISRPKLMTKPALLTQAMLLTMSKPSPCLFTGADNQRASQWGVR